MSELEPDPRVDEELRRRLEPSRMALRKVTRGALEEAEETAQRPFRWRPRPALLAPVGLLGVLALFLVLAPWHTPDPEDTGGLVSAGSGTTIELRFEPSSPRSDPASYRIENTRGVVKITGPSGQVLALVAGGTS